MAALSQLTDKNAQDFAQKIGDIFSSVPHLPKEWVAFLVKIAPVLVMIGAILSLISAFSFGFSGIYGLVRLVAALSSSALLFLAYKPLQEKKYEGWMYLFWSTIISAIESVIFVILGRGFVGALLGIVIGFYLLYELRPSYQGKIAALKKEVEKLTS